MPKNTDNNPAPKVTKLGNPFTGSWRDAKGDEIPKGSHVVTKDGAISGTVTSRWTNVKDGARIPFVSVEPPLDAAGVAAVAGGRPRKTVGVAASELVATVEKPKPARRTRARESELVLPS